VIGFRHFVSRVDRFHRPLKMRVLRLLRNVWVRYPIEPASSQNGILTTTTAETSGDRSASFCFFRYSESKIHPLTGREGTEGGWRYGFSLCLTSALGEGWMVNATLRPLYPRERNRYPLYRRLVGPQCRCGRLRKITLLPGFDPRTV